MTNANLNHTDIVAIEARARALRAQVARELVSSAFTWARRQFTFGTSTAAQSAA